MEDEYIIKVKKENNIMVIELTKFKKKSIERNNKYIETLSNVNEKYSYEFNFDFNEVKYYFDENILSIVMPLLYPVGLVHGTYIVCQNEIGMYLIDQHAAKERVNYELFLDKLTNPIKDKIPLLLPMTIELSNNEYIILKENFEFLNNMGFDIEEFGINSVIIKSHPVWLTKDFENLQIRKIIEAVIHKEKDFDLSKFNDHLSATLACKASIKANTNLSINEMEELINDLRKCNNPFNCPHGRPTIITFTKYELEKMFKRSGFESLK